MIQYKYDHSILSYLIINATATTEIYTLSLHDALPISLLFPENTNRTNCRGHQAVPDRLRSSTTLLLLQNFPVWRNEPQHRAGDRKSTRLNSSHSQISYAVFCLKKKTLNSMFIFMVGFY